MLYPSALLPMRRSSLTLSNTERVKFNDLLDVYISDTLGAAKQIEYVLKMCNQRLYLLNQLKR